MTRPLTVRLGIMHIACVQRLTLSLHACRQQYLSRCGSCTTTDSQHAKPSDQMMQLARLHSNAHHMRVEVCGNCLMQKSLDKSTGCLFLCCFARRCYLVKLRSPT